ncbi:MAG TPA: hypothetical protein VK497_04735 [Candidatus Saccharimonadales bacterium]|nr:hypothetical protein [Candidatus Saccharimonadales bacterium]
MSDKDPITDGSFNISLSEAEISQTIPKLLRHAMKYLKAEIGESKVYIPQLYLDRPYTSSDSPSLHVEYWAISDEQQELHDGAIEQRKKLRIAMPTEEVAYMPSKEREAELRMIEYRLSQDDNQADSILLIEKLADFLEEAKIKNILELIYHDFLDEDALNHPFVSVYYINRT